MLKFHGWPVCHTFVAMSYDTKMDKASVEKMFRKALATVSELEVRLEEARAAYEFWMRALQRKAMSELVSKYGGADTDSDDGYAASLALVDPQPVGAARRARAKRGPY